SPARKTQSVKSKKTPSKKPPVGKSYPLDVWLPPLCIAALTVIFFLPALQNGFVWDDESNIEENLSYRGLGWSRLRWMFTTFLMGHYQPLSWITLGSDYLIWGMNPFGYHLSNLILHVANAVLFYFVTRRLLRFAFSLPPDDKSPWQLSAGSTFAALLFAIHPLRVESVAWVTERRDVLAGFFFLWTIYCYLRALAIEDFLSQRCWLAGALVVYFLSLLSKASAMTLPVVLLLLDVYPLRRLHGRLSDWYKPPQRKVLWEKIPFFLLAAVFAVTALLAQHSTENLKPLAKYSLTSRIGQAFYGLMFYLWKTLLPTGLSVLYELPTQADQWFPRAAIAAGAAVMAISVVLFLVRRRFPGVLVAWLCYIVLVAPVLGIAQSGPQLVADRYSYFSCMAWAVLAGAALSHVWGWWQQRALHSSTLNLICVCAAGVLIVLGIMTWRQTQLWHDSERLWNHALAIDPNSISAYINLGGEMRIQNRPEAAIRYYSQAAALRSDVALPYWNLGDLFMQRGDLDAAARSYSRVVEIDPKAVRGYQGLAAVLAKKGRGEEAIALYLRVLGMDPNNARLHNDFGGLLISLGNMKKAKEHFQRAASLDPDRSEPYFNLGNLAVGEGNLNQAIAYYQRALEADPNYAEAHHNLGRVFAAEGRLDEAVEHFRQALRIRPNFVAARQSLMLALQEQERSR
ncbi:MAG TPA: tetratricopeptide repeat protein, partial [Candidatus Acidoferrales bacterium]|nr:tetratricopeptide repeat protein [Candidatus Acidoferrales bacterium]